MIEIYKSEKARYLSYTLLAGLLAGGCTIRQAAPPGSVKPTAAKPLDVRRGVVSVVVNGQDPDWLAPWSKQRPWRRYINGLVVPGNKILVYARYLAHNTLIVIDKDGSSRTYPAKMTLVDYDLPLALLEVDDPKFWDGLEPLPLAAEIPTEGEVTLNRWLSSGQFEKARGAIKQVKVGAHFPGRTQLLTMDISSAMTSAGWGEIVVHDNQVIGITTASSDDQQTVLSSSVVRRFLAETSQKTYRGTARHGFGWQPLANPALRKKLGLSPTEGGIRIRKVEPNGSAAGALEVGDVLLKIGDSRINERGNFTHPRYGRLFFGALFSEGAPGDQMTATVLRNGKRQEVKLTLRRILSDQDLIPQYRYDKPPEFIEVGGLVFQPLTLDYLRTWQSWFQNAPLRMVIEYSQRGRFPSQPGEQVVVLSRVLADTVNLGYEGFRSLVVSSVNERPIRSMKDLEAALASPKDGFHIVEFSPGQHQQRLVIDAAMAKAAEAGIRARYGLE